VDKTRTEWLGPAQYRLLIAGLAVLCLMLAVYPLLRAFTDMEISYNEGWNGYTQLRAARGETLYSGYSPFFVCNYPPLSFYIVGGLSLVFGDPILIGRLVSVASLAVVVGAVARIVRANGGEWLDAMLAAIVCLLTFLTNHIDYVGMNDPQMLGMAFGLLALALHLGAPLSARRSAGVALLMAASVLTKHNLLAIPIVVTIDTLVRGDRNVRLAYLGTGLLAALAAAGLLWIREGAAFYEQLLAPRIWSAALAIGLVTHLVLRNQALAILVAIGLIAINRRTEWLVLAYILVALAIGSVFSSGEGTVENMLFDFLIGLSIGAGMVVARLRTSAVPGIVVFGAVLAATCGPLMKAPLMLATGYKAATGELAARQAAFRTDVAYMKSLPGPAVCESLMLCLRAGKPMDVDVFNTIQAIKTGRLPANALTSRIAAHEFSAAQFKLYAFPDLSMASFTGGEMTSAFQDNRSDTTKAVFTALDKSYRPARVGIMGQFWVPAPAAP
jgi:uncharacterized membrane protein YozB (DUF420 family)